MAKKTKKETMITGGQRGIKGLTEEAETRTCLILSGSPHEGQG